MKKISFIGIVGLIVLCCLLALVLGGCRQPTPGQFTYWLGNYQPCIWEDYDLGNLTVLLDGCHDTIHNVLIFVVTADGYDCLSREGDVDTVVQAFCDTLLLADTAYYGWITTEMAELHDGFTLTRYAMKTASKSHRYIKHKDNSPKVTLREKEGDEISIRLMSMYLYLIDRAAYDEVPPDKINYTEYEHTQELQYTDGTTGYLKMIITFD